MPLTFPLFLLAAATLSYAADLSQYDPQPGVQSEFRPFLQAFVLHLAHIG